MFVAGGLWLVGAFGPVHLWSRYGYQLSPEASYFKGMEVGVPDIAFFGLCALGLLKIMLGPPIILRIDPDGILWTRWSPTIVPWSEVLDVSVSGPNDKSLNIKLRDASLYPGRGLLGFLASVNRELTGADISIIMTGMDCDSHDALNAISRFRTASTVGPTSFGRRHVPISDPKL